MPNESSRARYDGDHTDGAIMHALIERHRATIAELCRPHRVRRREVFGSGARETDFDPQCSDVGLLVEFDADDGAPALTTYFALRDDLAALLGRPVDLVMAGSLANPFVKAEVDRTREPVYGP
jgi:predicted nucleotidyltransferase